MMDTPGNKKRKVCLSAQKSTRSTKEPRFRELDTVDRFEADRRQRDKELTHRASIFSGALRVSKNAQVKQRTERPEVRASSVNLTPRTTLFTPHAERTTETTRRSTMQPFYNRSNTPAATRTYATTPSTTCLSSPAPSVSPYSSPLKPVEIKEMPRRSLDIQPALVKPLNRHAPKEQSVAACFGSHLSDVLHTYSLSRTPARQHVKALIRTPATAGAPKSVSHRPAVGTTPYSRPVATPRRDQQVPTTPYSAYQSTGLRQSAVDTPSTPESPTFMFNDSETDEALLSPYSEGLSNKVEIADQPVVVESEEQEQYLGEEEEAPVSPVLVRRLCL